LAQVQELAQAQVQVKAQMGLAQELAPVRVVELVQVQRKQLQSRSPALAMR
jgi:hypothetical protein